MEDTPFGCFTLIVTVIVILVIGYLISISNLPDWFKFFLLS